MARIEYREFRVLNPTPYKIRAAFDRLSINGAEFIFQPFEEKVIYNGDHVNHICDSKRKEGLVLLDYNDSAKQIYPTYDDFRRAKSIEGLNRCLARKQEALIYEETALAAAKEKPGELKTINPQRFQDDIDEINDLIGAIGQVNVVKKPRVKPDAPEWMTGKKEDKKEDEKDSEYPIVQMIDGKELKQLGKNKFMIDGKFVKKEIAEALLDVS